jgi:hypothetical protein
MSTPEQPAPLNELANVTDVQLARVPICSRENGIKLSGWRLAVRTPRGDGTITLVDAAGGATFRRGEGLFLGWDQARLAAAYAQLLPKGSSPEPDPGQFG